MAKLRDFERRILAYLDQRGVSHRMFMVPDLSPPDSHTACHGSSANAARLFGAWSRRLKLWGFVHEVRDARGFYRGHKITPAGRSALREAE